MEKLLNDFLNVDLHKEIIKLINNSDKVDNSENSKTWYLGDSEVTIGKTPEGAAFVHYKVDKTSGIVSDFKKYLENLEDDVFIQACDNFEIRLGNGSLQAMEGLMENPTEQLKEYIREFKNSVQMVVTSRIEALTKKYLV